ncbi:hypothetical protein OH828_24575 [Streptomyces anulatus]|uniref:hypothetical protein n=1 Tax=Streptomyces anulatus TaxID=1892 RepID=UPI0032472D76|nr:hypothetical protein OH791_24310 [Streptomyces anulatus]
MTSDALPPMDVDARPVESGRRRTAARLTVSLFLLAAAAMLLAALLGAYEWYLALACWLLGFVAVPVRHGVTAGREMIREVWRLRTHGVLVEGRRQPLGAYEYTDLDGRTHRLVAGYESAQRVEVLHDPAAAGQTAQVGRRTAGTLAFAVLLLLLSLAMTAALAVIGLAGPLTALGVISPGIFSGPH